MLGKLYVHVSDSERFLLVNPENCFPHASLDPSDWRAIEIGADTPTNAQLQILRQRGFVQYRMAPLG